MPKISKKQIGEDEKKVIRELKKDSKESVDNIAKRCGFSKQKTRRAIRRLEKDKTIWGYHVITDDEKLNRKHYTVLFKRANVPFDEKMHNSISTERLDDLLPDGNITVEDCLYVHGDYDWILTFTAPDTKQMKKFIEKIFSVYGKYLTEFNALETIFPIRKQGFKHPLAKKQVEIL